MVNQVQADLQRAEQSTQQKLAKAESWIKRHLGWVILSGVVLFAIIVLVLVGVL